MAGRCLCAAACPHLFAAFLVVACARRQVVLEWRSLGRSTAADSLRLHWQRQRRYGLGFLLVAGIDGLYGYRSMRRGLPEERRQRCVLWTLDADDNANSIVCGVAAPAPTFDGCR